MELSNMLDVLHYLFETDVNFSSNEQMEFKNSTRKVVYKSVYNKEFKYGYGSGSNTSQFDDDSYEFPAAQQNEVKPYIPPTNFDPDAVNPFQGTLRETPLG